MSLQFFKKNIKINKNYGCNKSFLKILKPPLTLASFESFSAPNKGSEEAPAMSQISRPNPSETRALCCDFFRKMGKKVSSVNIFMNPQNVTFAVQEKLF